MTPMKSLMLAAVTVLSLGAGGAMAQEGGSTYPRTPNYWAPDSAGQIQSGSSDVTPDPRRQIPNWLDLPTYGGRG